MPSLIRTAEISPYSLETTGHLSSFFTRGPEPEARTPSACTIQLIQNPNQIRQPFLFHIVPLKLVICHTHNSLCYELQYIRRGRGTWLLHGHVELGSATSSFSIYIFLIIQLVPKNGGSFFESPTLRSHKNVN